MVHEVGAAGHFLVQEAAVPTAFSYCRLQSGEQDSHAATALCQGAQTPGITDANAATLLSAARVLSPTRVRQRAQTSALNRTPSATKQCVTQLCFDTRRDPLCPVRTGLAPRSTSLSRAAC